MNSWIHELASVKLSAYFRKHLGRQGSEKPSSTAPFRTFGSENFFGNKNSLTIWMIYYINNRLLDL